MPQIHGACPGTGFCIFPGGTLRAFLPMGTPKGKVVDTSTGLITEIVFPGSEVAGGN